MDANELQSVLNKSIATLPEKCREVFYLSRYESLSNKKIAEKLNISQATLSEHMRVLMQAGLVRPRKIKQWIFYKRDEARIQNIKDDVAARL